ncbi:MAG: putative cytosol aminopeptidase [Rhodothalassiaceae bacterium]|nr:MAG: putative cytosol aminopeptidase [Rhodothalassiaceae bacterium]
MDTRFVGTFADAEDALVVVTAGTGPLTGAAAALDEQAGGALSRAVAASRFKGRKGERLELVAPAGLSAKRVLLLGAGDKDGAAATLSRPEVMALGGAAAAALVTSGARVVRFATDGIKSELAPGELAAEIAAGFNLRAWRFDKYRTKEPAEKKPSVTTLEVATGDEKGAAAAWADLAAVLDGVRLTRELVSEPPNVLYPETFAARIRELEKEGIAVEILDEEEMRRLGMNALLGVGQGSVNAPRLGIMIWRGADEKDAPIAFVGKGVTFDAGGISLKPAEGMDQMKWDMGGAGIVTGTMLALARRKAKVNAVGVVGLVENLPSGSAQRPGDVVTSLSGQTIEILNTDAEGRLVLADAMWYTQDRFKPALMIDLATLTGAMIIALGHEYAGYFTDHDDIASGLEDAGRESGDKVWRMPLHENYDKLIDTPTADVKNIGPGREAGSIVAAQFLKRFTNGVPWAHIDVAGVVWAEKDGPTFEKGATGWGVRLLDFFVRARERR